MFFLFICVLPRFTTAFKPHITKACSLPLTPVSLPPGIMSELCIYSMNVFWMNGPVIKKKGLFQGETGLSNWVTGNGQCRIQLNLGDGEGRGFQWNEQFSKGDCLPVKEDCQPMFNAHPLVEGAMVGFSPSSPPLSLYKYLCSELPFSQA